MQFVCNFFHMFSTYSFCSRTEYRRAASICGPCEPHGTLRDFCTALRIALAWLHGLWGSFAVRARRRWASDAFGVLIISIPFYCFLFISIHFLSFLFISYPVRVQGKAQLPLASHRSRHDGRHGNGCLASALASLMVSSFRTVTQRTFWSLWKAMSLSDYPSRFVFVGLRCIPWT